MKKVVWICSMFVLTAMVVEAKSTSTTIDRGRRHKRAMGIKNKQGSERWPNNMIPYDIDVSEFTTEEQTLIEDAMADWSRYTCIRFKRTTTPTNKLVFKGGNQCRSVIGMAGTGLQLIELAKGCRTKGMLLHVLGHAIGLIHETSRPDRDLSVRINEQNIQTSKLRNFRKLSWNDVDILKSPKDTNTDISKTPYDINSIMHYRRNDLSMNGNPTVESIDNKPVGHKDKLTFDDIKTVNLMYKCSLATKLTKWCFLSDDACPNDGFVGTDCDCWCRGEPYTLCWPNGRPQVTFPAVTKPPIKKPPVTQSPLTKPPTVTKPNKGGKKVDSDIFDIFKNGTKPIDSDGTKSKKKPDDGIFETFEEGSHTNTKLTPDVSKSDDVIFDVFKNGGKKFNPDNMVKTKSKKGGDENIFDVFGEEAKKYNPGNNKEKNGKIGNKKGKGAKTGIDDGIFDVFGNGVV